MARVYVGNVPYRSTEEDLRAAFEQAGCTVSEVVIPKLPDGRSKGFAFVEVDDLEKALALDNSDLDGRTIKVSEARPPRERTPRSDESHAHHADHLPIRAAEFEAASEARLGIA